MVHPDGPWRQLAADALRVGVAEKTLLGCNGAVVRELRKQCGFSRPGLAKETRRRFLARECIDYCSLSTIKRIELGQPALADKVHAVAGALGVPVATILAEPYRAMDAPARHGPVAMRPEVTRPSIEAGPLAVRMACEERFRKILVDDYLLVIEGRMPAQRYWKSYWYHQWDQFRYWRDGLLDSDSFLAWIRFRHLEYDENLITGDIDYRSGWEAARHWIQDGDFARFMDHVFRGDFAGACRPYSHLLAARPA